MKQQLLAFFLLFFLASDLCSQVESNTLASDATPFLCAPGVRHRSPSKGAAISYSFNPAYRMQPPNAESPREVRTNQQLAAKIKIPVVNRPSFKCLVGFKYGVEKHDLTGVDPQNFPLFQRLNDVDLKKSEMAAYVVKPLNEKLYSSLRLSVGFQGDYGGFLRTNGRYAVYRAAGILGVKKSDDLEYGVGLYYSRNVRRSNLLPFGFCNYTFNDRWGLEAALPAGIKLRRNVSEGQLALFGLEYASQSYTMNVVEPPVNGTQPSPVANLYQFRRGSVVLAGSYFYQSSEWTWFEFKLGYVFDLNSRAWNLTAGETFDLQPSGSIMASVVFFLSPPKRLLHN